MRIRFRQFCMAGVGLALVAMCVGCGDTGPSTVPVKGTLTINGQPANDVQITFQPVSTGLQPASGLVKGGSFELMTGSMGKKGAMPGKYKVVLAPVAGDMEAAKAMYSKGQGEKGGPPPAPKASFPDKYKDVQTSDKEVEVKAGSPDIKIEI